MFLSKMVISTEIKAKICVLEIIGREILERDKKIIISLRIEN
jgi:hypothetical protein